MIPTATELATALRKIVADDTDLWDHELRTLRVAASALEAHDKLVDDLKPVIKAMLEICGDTDCQTVSQFARSKVVCAITPFLSDHPELKP